MEMAAASGQPGTRLIDRLVQSPEGFELFEAVRVVEDAAVRAARAAGRDLPPEVGGQAGAAEPVRFGTALTFGFPGAAVVAASPAGQRGDDDPELSGEPAARGLRLEIASFGLIGPAGVLPRHYTTLAIERLRRFRDRSLRDFLDLFVHRATSLLVRAWGKYRVVVQRWRLASRGRGAGWDDGPQPRDATAAVLACLVGLGGRTEAERMRLEDNLVLHYAGALSRQPASAVLLEQVVADAWGVPARVEQFVGRWLDLEPGDQTQLGGGNAALGVDALAGRRVWSIESAYCVRLGPLSYADFCGWLPGSGRLEALSDLLTFHVGPVLEAAIRPVLRAGEVPQTQLGGQQGSRLGWTTWLVTARPVRDADDAFFSVEV
jgi:type VI secretion system protein ImpH